MNENRLHSVVVSSRASLASIFSVVLLLLTLLPAAWAQATAASITGTVTDPAGAAVPDAKVTVTNMETSAKREVSTDSSGSYRVLSLPVGIYEVHVQKPGFEESVWSGIKLNVGQARVEDVQLALSAAVQEVTVTASVAQAPVVNTTTSQVSGLVPEQEIKDLPLNGRGWDQLITLNPATVNFSTLRSSNTTTSNGNAFSVDGLRPGDNLYLLNAVELTGASQLGVTPGGVGGAASSNSGGGLLGADAVREFNLLTGTYSAQYGKRAGGQVLVVTNSGTNAIHGTAYEFLRNNVLDARNFFDKGPAPPFKRNQFGASIGAPLKKDKLFLFANYEGFRQRLSVTSVSFAPDAVISPDNVTGSTTPTFATTVPGMQPFLAMWPVHGPNDVSLTDANGNPTGVAKIFRNPSQSIDEDFGTARLDYVIGPRDTLSGAYTGDVGNSLIPQSDPLFASALRVSYQVFSLQHTHVFSPQVINSFTFGYSRATFSNDPASTSLFADNLNLFNQITGLSVTSDDLALVLGRGPGGIAIGGGLTTTGGGSITGAGPNNASNVWNARNLYTFTDNVQLSKGRHQFNFGVWLQPLQDNEDTASRQLGQVSFNSLSAFQRGTFSSFQLVPIHTELGWRSFMGAWYVEDVIRLRRNLTVRLGLRHEFDNGWNEVRDRASQFLLTSSPCIGTSPCLETVPTVGHSAFTDNNAKALFGPRVGLAWDIFGDGSTALQAGFGMHYTMLDALAFQLNSNPGAISGTSAFNGSISEPNSVPLYLTAPVNPNTPIPAQCGTPNALPPPACTKFAPQGVQQNVKIPTVEKWNVAIERRLTDSIVLRVGYEGSFGYHQLVSLDPNTVMPVICTNPAGCVAGGVQASGLPATVTSVVPQGTLYVPVGRRPNPNLASAFYWFSEGNSSYNALTIDVTKRYSRRLQFRANYTLARNFDNNSAPTGAQANNQAQMVLNRFDLHQDWGPSALTPTHIAHFAATYTLPFGRGQRWGGDVRGPADKLVSGWVLNMITTLESGFPLTPLVGSNVSGTGDTRNPDRPSLNAGFNGPIITGSPSQWFNPNAFVIPAAGTFGNVGRGSLNGPGLAEVDISLLKETAIAEGLKLEFRTECFNVLNHTNFGTPNLTVFSNGTISPTAGQVTYTATTSRQIQFGVKLIY